MSLVDFFAHSDGQQWMTEAECALPEYPHAWWFPDADEGETAVKAIKVCADCIVVEECLAYALVHGEQGVWGGTSEKTRKRMKRDAKKQALAEQDQA